MVTCHVSQCSWYQACSWWRHQMETFSALLAICAGNSPVPGEVPTQRQVTRTFDVYFDLRPNKRLSKQSWGWWFETPSHPLWRHCNVLSLHSVVAASSNVNHTNMAVIVSFIIESTAYEGFAYIALHLNWGYVNRWKIVQNGWHKENNFCNDHYVSCTIVLVVIWTPFVI